MSVNESSDFKLQRMEARIAALELASQRKMGQDSNEPVSRSKTETGPVVERLPVPLRGGDRMSRSSGKIVIKVSLGDDTRRLKVAVNHTYKQLVELVALTYKIANIAVDDAYRIKFKAEDGDLVTLTDDDDVSHLIYLNPIPKLILAAPQKK